MSGRLSIVYRQWMPALRLSWRVFFVAAALTCCALLWASAQALAQATQPATMPQACQASASLVTSQDNSISSEPVVNKDGRRIAFWSTVNELGLNPDGSIELFVAATDPITPGNSFIVRQVSESLGNILGGFNIMPDIVSAQSGGVRRTLVVFASDRDLVAGRNPDGGFEIFLAQIEPSFWIMQVTDTERSASILPSMSDLLPDGRTVRIVFLSDADDREHLPKADNPDRNQEVFLATVDILTRSAAAQQVTRSDVDVINDQPVLNAVGDHLAFVSNSTRPLSADSTVTNGDGNREIFLGHVENNSVSLRQLTITANGDNASPVISDQGHRLAFVSSARGLPGVSQLTNNEGGGVEQVVAAAVDDAGATRFTSLSANLKKPQGSAGPVPATEPSISSDGRRIVFVAPGCAPNQAACTINPASSQLIVADENRLTHGVYFLGQATGFDEIQANEVFRRPAVSGDGRSLAVTFQGVGATYSGIDFLACPIARVILTKDFVVDSVANLPQVDPRRPDVGDRVLYEVSLLNDSSTLFGARLRITDTLPLSQMTLISTSVVSGAGAFEQPPVQIGDRLVWQVKDIPPQSVATVRIAMRVNSGRAGANIVNSVVMTVVAESQSGQALIENLETESALRVTRVDLSARLAVSTQIPRENVPFDYTITVTNAAGMDPATNVRVIDTAPLAGDFQLDSATPSLGSYNPANHTWTIPVLYGGQSAVLRLRVRPNAGSGGKPPVAATINAPQSDQEDINPANNIVIGAVNVRVLGTDLQVMSKTVDTKGRNPPQGEVVTYTIRLRNNGPLSPTDPIYLGNQAAFVPSVVEVTDVLPGGVAFVSASDNGIFDATTGAVVWRVAGMPAGGEKNLTLRVRAIADPGMLISNQVNAIVGRFADGSVMNDVAPANNLPPDVASFIVNQGAGVQLAVAPTTMPENSVVAVTVSYTDPDLVDTHVVAIFWGDGATQTTAPINRGGIITGTAAFTHTYADDDADDRYTILAVVTDSTGNTASGTRVVTVTNVAPTLNPLAVSGQVRNLGANHFLVTTSHTLQVQADFSDPGFSGPPGNETFTYQVDWGDGVIENGPVTNVTNGRPGVPSTGRFTLTHQYSQLGVRTVVVRARDDDGGEGQRSFTVTVNNAPKAHDDAVSVDENSAVSGNMLTNDRPDGDAFPVTSDILTVTQVITSSTRGVLVTYNSASGSFTYSAAGKFEELAQGQNATDTFTYLVRDLFAFTSTAKVNITVLGVNDAPVLALNAATRAFVEDKGNVQLAGGLTISDVDNGARISRAQVTIVNPLDGAAERTLATATQPGITASYANGILTLDGLASLADYQSVLRSVVYTNTDDTPNLTTRTISFVVFDEHNAASAQPTLAVTVQDTNDPPVATLLSFTATEDIPLAIGQRIQVADPDAVNDSLRLTATVEHGALTLPGAAGDGTRQVVIMAGLATLNSLNLTYLGDADYTGPDVLTVRVNDLGHNPSGPLSDMKARPFFVLSVDDAPRVRLASLVPNAMSENTQVAATVVYTDPDVGETQVVQVDWGDGTPASSVLTSTTGVPSMSRTLVFTHTYADDDDDDRYTVFATVTDSTMLAGNDSAQVTVTNVLPTLQPLSISGAEKVIVPNQDVVATTLTPLTARGIFSDPGFTVPPSQEAFTTTVNWGDGLSETLPITAIVNGRPGVATTGVFTRSHLYTTYGVFTATVTLFDDDDPTGDTASFRVTVSDIPASSDDFFALDEDGDIGGNVLANDVKSGPDDDLDILPVNLTDTKGQVSNVITETGAFSYTAAGFFEQLAQNELADDSFQYTAINLVGFTNTATAHFTIIGVNDTPVLALNAATRAFVEDTGNVQLADSLIISDVDNGARISRALITVTNPLDGAAEQLLTTTQPGITASYANGVLTLDGLASLADYQSVLRSVVYTNTDDTPNTTARSLRFVIFDEHDAASNVRSLTVTVQDKNDAPIVALSAFTTVEDIPVNIQSAIWITDVDALNGVLKLTAAVIKGRLSITAAPGVTVTINNASSVEMLGTLANLRNLLLGAGAITYLGDPDYFGSDTLTVTLNDQGHTPSGPLSDTKSLVFPVLAVNDAPVIGPIAPSAIFVEDQPPVKVASTVLITDVDSANLLGATVTLAATPDGALESLAAAVGGGMVANYDPASRTLTISGLASRVAYQTALRNVVYNNASNIPTLTPRVASFTVWDDMAAASNTRTQTINVQATNDAPTITLSGSAPSVQEGGSATIIDAGVVVSDTDTPIFAGGRLTVTVVGGAAGSDFLDIAVDGDITLSGNQVLHLGVAFGVASGRNSPNVTVALDGNASLAAVQALARNMTYRRSDKGKPPAAVDVRFQTSDGQGGVSNQAAKSVSIGEVNDAPEIAIASFSPMEDTLFTFGATIAITDYDAENGSLRITVTVNSGVLAVTTGDLDASPRQVVMQANLSTLKMRLAAMTYLSDLHYNGPDLLSVSLNDLGNTGSGGPQTSTATMPFTVTAVNDAPTVQINVINGVEDTPLDIRPSIVISDVDAGAASLRITVTVASGTLSASGLTVVSGGGTGTLVVTGSLVEFAAATITYAPALNVNGAVNLSVAANDQGATGAGGAKSGSANGAINLSAVNDAPTVTITPFQVEEDTTTNIRPFIAINDVDAGASSLRITMTVTSGTLQAVGFTPVSGQGTSTLVMLRTSAQFEAAIVNYTPLLDFIGNVTLGVTANDQGATGSGGPKSGNASFVFSVSNDNDPPVLDLNGPDAGAGFGATFTEDQGAVLIVSPNLTLVDVDSTIIFSATARIVNLLDGASEQLTANNVGAVTTSYSNGVLSLNGPAALADFQAALRTVRYNNLSQNPTTTTRSVLFLVKDFEGALSGPVFASVVVVAVNDTPTVLLSGATLNVVEGDPAVQIDPTAQVIDPDSTSFVSGGVFTVTVQGGNDTRDKVNIGAFGNISVSGSNVRFSGNNIGTHSGLDKAQVKVTLNNGATIAQVQALAQAFTYRQTNGPNIPSRTILFELKENGAVGAASAVKNVTITTSEPPAITLGTTAASFTEGGTAVVIAPSLTVVDDDSTNMSGATVQIVNLLDAGQETLSATGGGGVTPSYNPATGVLTLSGSSNKNNYQTALRSVTYHNASQDPSSTARLLRFTIADDSALTSAPVTATLTIIGVNDPPTVSFGAITAVEDTPLEIRPSIVISDLDAGAASLRITITVSSGILLTSLPNETGNGTGQLVVIASRAEFNASALTYSPPPNFNGMVNLGVAVNDQGATPPPAQTGSANASFNVAAVNDPPTVTVNSVSADEDTPTNIQPRIIISDVDAAAGSLRITVTVDGGQLFASAPLTTLSGAGTTDLEVTGSLAQYATSAITYTPPANFSGAINLKVRVNDQGNTGSGGPKLALGDNVVTVAPVDDPPILVVNSGITITTPLTTGVVTVTLPMTTLRYSDVDTPASGIVYTMTTAPAIGALLLNTAPLTVGATFTQDDIDQGWLRYRFNAATPQPFTTSFKFRVRREAGLPERTYNIRIE